MTIYGYSRVSTNSQDWQSQLTKLEMNGAEEIYREKYTGTKRNGRKELRRLLDNIQPNDKVLVTKIDRLARSIVDLRQIIQDVINKGASIQFIEDNLTFDLNSNNPANTLMLNMLGAFAEFERDLIVTRTQEGKEWAKKNNPNFEEGRPERILNKKYLHALELMQNNTMKQVEEKTGISRATLYRIKRQYREEVTKGIRANDLNL
ncbi:MAG: recombinase family protein [Senegalia sp. (in: firmicutes)]